MIRVVDKEKSALMRVLSVLLFWNRSFMTSYTTTIGRTVYMPSAVRDSPLRERVLRHEAVHVRQFARHPLWFPLSYLFVPPFGITMRARWELEAYVESMRAELEETGTIGDVEHLIRLFTGPEYLFMDVRARTVRRKLERARQELLDARG